MWDRSIGFNNASPFEHITESFSGRVFLSKIHHRLKNGSATRLWVIAIDCSLPRTASEGHATLGASPSVKWVCDPFFG
jgi:hypothetical protein